MSNHTYEHPWRLENARIETQEARRVRPSVEPDVVYIGPAQVTLTDLAALCRYGSLLSTLEACEVRWIVGILFLNQVLCFLPLS